MMQYVYMKVSKSVSCLEIDIISAANIAGPKSCTMPLRHNQFRTQLFYKQCTHVLVLASNFLVVCIISVPDILTFEAVKVVVYC